MNRNVNNIQDRKLEEYINNLKQFHENFKCRFEDLKQLQSTFSFFVNPFLCDVLNDEFLLSDIILAKPDVAKLELLEMKEDIALKMHHKSTSLVEFWKLVSESQYPQLKKAAARLISMFGTTYCCESLYSTMKNVKNKNRSRLTNQHLTELIRTTLTNYAPDFKEIIKNSS